MSAIADQVNAVVDVLRQRGAYRECPKPLHIADVDYEFQFDAIMEGPGDDKSLVLVCAADPAVLSALERRVLSLSHALRRVRSTRPLTLVLVTDNPDPAQLVRLGEACRIIPVTAGQRAEVAIASLLPLPMPVPSHTMRSATEALRQALDSSLDHPLCAALLKAASDRSEAVEKVVLDALKKAAIPSVPENLT
jgi:hypothetical protein